MQVQMLVKAGDSNVVHVNLFGEDGRYLDGTLKAVAGSPDGDPLLLKVPFEIRAAGENGFIQVSTDDIHHRPQSLITVPVLLLSSGESQINPAGNTIYERVAFSHLRPDSEVSGGILKAEGELMPYSRQPFIMELATDEGRVLGTRLVPVSGTDWQSFSTTIPYKVDKRTSARLYVHEADDVLNGPAYIYSQPMTLLP
jgi:hypothetical protein